MFVSVKKAIVTDNILNLETVEDVSKKNLNHEKTGNWVKFLEWRYTPFVHLASLQCMLSIIDSIVLFPISTTRKAIRSRSA